MTQPKLSARAPLLSVRDLSIEFRGRERSVYAADGVSFDLFPGEVLGLVGESGCGKSATSLAIMGLLPKPNGRLLRGEVYLREQNLSALSQAEFAKIRGHKIAMIFQDPMTSLNPYLTVEEQLCEVPMLHLGLTRAQARERALALLTRVGIPDAPRRIKSYPHEFSGGMRQRVMIVMALLCDPEVLIADEPTTALDVTIQAQILELLAELSAERGLSVILITHDLAVVARTCDRVVVMYAGRVVETALVGRLFAAPSHPYTRALLASVPRVDGVPGETLFSIPGLPPRLETLNPGKCTFGPRCMFHYDLCDRGEPALVDVITAEPVGSQKRRCVLPVADLSRGLPLPAEAIPGLPLETGTISAANDPSEVL